MEKFPSVDLASAVPFKEPKASHLGVCTNALRSSDSMHNGGKQHLNSTPPGTKILGLIPVGLNTVCMMFRKQLPVQDVGWNYWVCTSLTCLFVSVSLSLIMPLYVSFSLFLSSTNLQVQGMDFRGNWKTLKLSFVFSALEIWKMLTPAQAWFQFCKKGHLGWFHA